MVVTEKRFFSFSFLESNKKKSNAGLLKQMRLCPRNNSIIFFWPYKKDIDKIIVMRCLVFHCPMLCFEM